MKVLVVDDSSTMRAILRAMFADLGCEVHALPNGVEAMSELRGSAPYDLVVIDWNMPLMTGLELIAALRAMNARSGLPVLVVSSQATPEQINAALEAGADEYLFKPFDADILERTLALMGLLPQGV